MSFWNWCVKPAPCWERTSTGDRRAGTLVKVDASSGTALMLVEPSRVSLPYEPEYVYDRHMIADPANTVKPESPVRAVPLPDAHEVLFLPERMRSSNSGTAAQSRRVFAAGALNAARGIWQDDARAYTACVGFAKSLLEHSPDPLCLAPDRHSLLWAVSCSGPRTRLPFSPHLAG